MLILIVEKNCNYKI